MTPAHTIGNNWIMALLALTGVTAAWLLVVAVLGVVLGISGGWNPLSGLEAQTAREMMGGFPEVIVAILGIIITVVSITLQLAATRYTHRVTEMFFHDKGNLGVLAFYVVASVHCVVAAILIRNGIVPPVLLVSTLLIVIFTVLLLVPYFIYVFAFLDPARLVVHLKHQAVNTFLPGDDGHGGQQLAHAQLALRGYVEQLSDVALHALTQQDRGIASLTSESLKGIAATYLGQKTRMGDKWFRITNAVRHCPELEILSQESVDRLERDGCWMEWMILRQMFTLYQASLNRMRDVVRLVSINVRQLAEMALRNQDHAVLELTIRFFNSFLRSAINQADVRSAYNVLDQYRHLAELALEDDRKEIVNRISKNIAYYGRIASHAGLPFVTESAAYDLEALCEMAFERGSDVQLSILGRLLKVDEVPESHNEERSLRGVRKAQIKLACFYLSVQREDMARTIADDMIDEDPNRLARLQDELLAATQPDFWEVVDRGKNFDYLPPSFREQLPNFFQLLDAARA